MLLSYFICDSLSIAYSNFTLTDYIFLMDKEQKIRNIIVSFHINYANDNVTSKYTSSELIRNKSGNIMSGTNDIRLWGDFSVSIMLFVWLKKRS